MFSFQILTNRTYQDLLKSGLTGSRNLISELKEPEVQNLDEIVLESPVASHTLVLSEDNESFSSLEASISVDTSAPILGKEALIEKFVEQAAPIPWEDTHRGVEWTKKWNDTDFIPSSKVLTDHIGKADELLTNADFKTQLKVTALSTKNLQGLHYATQDKVKKLLEKAEKLDMETKLDKKRFIRPISEKAQLDEIQSSVELLLSLLLSDDAKKGEKIVKSKCSNDQIMKKKDDEADDQGNPSKLKGKQTTVYYKDPKIQTLDEEIARRLFLKHNPGTDLENLKEEEARFKAEKINLKPKASIAKKPPRPKEKGIVIKEKSSTEASKPKTRSQSEIDPKDKGKGKVDEPIKPLEMKIPQILMKPVCKIVQVIDDNLAEDKDVQTLKRKKISEESKTTSDKDQVVQSEELQATTETASSDKIIKTSTSDSAQFDLDKMKVAEKKKLLWKNVKPSDPKKSQLLSDFMTVGLKAREARDRAGLGSDEAKIKAGVEVLTRVPFLLTDQPLEDVTQNHLDKVFSVQVVLDAHDKHNVKENLILFLEDGRTYQMSESDVLNKSLKELQFFHYLLEGNVYATMKILLILNDCLERNHISALRTAIYQIGSQNEEMKQVKTTLSQVLRIKEEKLISSFVKNHYGFRLTH
ncbi:hypothetical protein AgCh_022368 [Apium graveolens]